MLLLKKLADMFRAMLNPLSFGTVVLCGAGWAGKSLAEQMLLHGIARVHARRRLNRGGTISRANYYANSVRSLTSVNVFWPMFPCCNVLTIMSPPDPLPRLRSTASTILQTPRVIAYPGFSINPIVLPLPVGAFFVAQISLPATGIEPLPNQ